MTTSPRRVLAARILAVVADAVQIGFVPLFVEGAASPVNDVLDVVVGAAMIALVGWHWVFVPAFVAELVPFADIAPTWTLAVLIATRRQAAAPSPSSGSPPTPGAPGPTPRALPGGGAASDAKRPLA